MPATTSNNNNNKEAVYNDYTRLGESYRIRERKLKVEMAIVSLLWLVGCPVLCLLPHSGSDYGKPVSDDMCGAIAYSVSASMTGLYPKVWGSIMAPWFSVLIVQRSTNGLCAYLRLGWLVRFSSLIQARAEGTPLVKTESSNTSTDKAMPLWKRIDQIEFLGYVAGAFLIALVAFDSKNFMGLHLLFSAIAFFSLTLQNRMVGTLGADFPEFFPNWTSPYAHVVFFWGMAHLVLMYGSFFALGTVQHFDKCNELWSVLGPDNDMEWTRWLVSVICWANEYIFAFLSIYVQLLEHYELELWDFCGARHAAFLGIVPRFSVWTVLERRVRGDAADAKAFLGTSTIHNKAAKAE